MDQLDREVIESLSEPAKRVFGSLDYRSRQRMLKKAKAMAKKEKTRNQKKSRVKKKGIEKQNKAKRKKKGSSSKSERVLFSIYETKDLMVQSMHLMLLGSSVADNAYEERDFAHTDEPQVALSRETVQKSSRVAMGGMRTLVQRNRHKKAQRKAAGKSTQKSAQAVQTGAKAGTQAAKTLAKTMQRIVRSVAANPVVWIVLLVIILLAVIVGASRGVYCVPILQSLAQLKTLFVDGAWEGIVGNCDTFIYLGGNEASTYEYVSKLLGKWTIDKRTSGESKGTSGSYSENYDVLGRELMLEYELRLLPDDECIIFVRGENPIRDKKWFPWEHEAYLEARKCGAFVPAVQKEKQKQQMEECDFIGEESLEYLKKQQSKNENIRLYELDAFSFMMMDLDAMEKKIHSTPKDVKGAEVEKTITAGMIQSEVNHEMKREAEERKAWFIENFDKLTLLDIYASEWTSETRRKAIRELLQAGAEEDVIKSIIRPEIEEGQVLQKKKMWLEMKGKGN